MFSPTFDLEKYYLLQGYSRRHFVNKLEMEKSNFIPDTVLHLIAKFIDDIHFIESTIVQSTEAQNTLGLLLENEAHCSKLFPLKLLFCAKLHGFDANAFHSKCDGFSPTLTIIQVKYENDDGNVECFGGYTRVPWTSVWNYHSDNLAFLFFLTDKKYHVSRMKIGSRHSNYAVYHSYDMGPSFGMGHDLGIKDICDQRMNEARISSYDATDFPQAFKVYNYEVFQVK